MSISVKEFNYRVVSFREKFGTKMDADQYENLKKMFVISYLDVDKKEFTDHVAMVFETTLNEFNRRMVMMGIDI